MPPNEGFPRRGEIYWVELSPTIGSEQSGRRPAVVLSNDDANALSPVVTVAPTTTQPTRKMWAHEVHVPAGVGGLQEDSRVLINQVRTVAKLRVKDFIGILPLDYVAACDQALKYHFALWD